MANNLFFMILGAHGIHYEDNSVSVKWADNIGWSPSLYPSLSIHVQGYTAEDLARSCRAGQFFELAKQPQAQLLDGTFPNFQRTTWLNLFDIFREPFYPKFETYPHTDKRVFVLLFFCAFLLKYAVLLFVPVYAVGLTYVYIYIYVYVFFSENHMLQ